MGKRQKENLRYYRKGYMAQTLVALNLWFSTREDLTPRGHLAKFATLLLAMTEGLLLASSESRPGLLINIRDAPGSFSHQRKNKSEMVIVLKLRIHTVNEHIKYLKRVKTLGNNERLLKGDWHYQFSSDVLFFPEN